MRTAPDDGWCGRFEIRSKAFRNSEFDVSAAWLVKAVTRDDGVLVRSLTFDRISLGNVAGFLNLVTDHGPVDITYMPDGTTGYPDLIRSVVIIRVGDEGVPVADLADVIRSKEAAGRTKDLEVLPRLHKFLRGRPKERRAKD